MDSPRTELEVMIEQEAKELAEVPKIPIQQFMGGPKTRCHLCGQLHPTESLQPFEVIDSMRGPQERLAGPCCHPNRGANAGT